MALMRTWDLPVPGFPNSTRYLRQEESCSPAEWTGWSRKVFALRQAVDDILVDGPLQWRQRVKTVHRPGLQTADAGVYYAALPKIVYVMQGHDIADQSGHEAGLVPFMVELLADLLRSGPAVWHKGEGLRKMLDGRRHCGLLQMSELGRVSMRMVYQQMLEEEDGVEGGHQLDGHQILVCPQGFGFVLDGGMTA